MSPKVFLDSGILIALMSRRDRWHAQAAALFSGDRPRWVTSLLVVSEAYSWFLHRIGEEAARAFRSLLANLDALVLVEATVEHHAAVEKMLDRLRGAKLTYVDASSLVWIEELDIGRVWATDHHLGLTGREVLPRQSAR